MFTSDNSCSFNKYQNLSKITWTRLKVDSNILSPDSTNNIHVFLSSLVNKCITIYIRCGDDGPGVGVWWLWRDNAGRGDARSGDVGRVRGRHHHQPRPLLHSPPLGQETPRGAGEGAGKEGGRWEAVQIVSSSPDQMMECVLFLCPLTFVLSVRLFIPPANEVGGVYRNNPVCPSVRPSVHLSRVNLTLTITF